MPGDWFTTAEFLYKPGEIELGPVHLHEILRMLVSGEIGPETPVREKDWAYYLPASRLEEQQRYCVEQRQAIARKRRISAIVLLSVIVPVLLVTAGYYAWAYKKIESRAQAISDSERSVPTLQPTDIRETGVVIDLRVTRDYWKLTKEIVWWVKIPRTGKIFSCTYSTYGSRSGFAGFERLDGVMLAHSRASSSDPDWDGYGSIVGLSGLNKGKVAIVWVLDCDELADALDDEG